MLPSAHDIQTAIKALYATGQFDDVQIVCRVSPSDNKATLVIQVKERPILSDYKVIGADRVSPKDVKEKLAFATGGPVDPGKIAKAIASTDSLYESKGYYLATVKPESTITDGKLSIKFNVDEGKRLAISGIRINGNKGISDGDIVSAMDTKPEGFLFTRNGELDDDIYAQDLSEKIPQLYASRGYIDFRILKDTLIVDRAKGKGLLDITVSEGPRYTVGNFEVIGNRRFSSDQINAFYPFGKAQQTTVVQKATGLIRRSYTNPPNTFDEARWDDAQQKLMEAYNDEGYIYANIRPVTERVPSTDSVRTVNLRWEIDERSPAIVNRIEIVGNDYTHESCIREQIVLAPGQVFNRNYLIRSYQNIGNLNFFETPMAAPETRPSGDQGDVDIVFNVKEKRTGNVNFGASMGQGTGLGGFIGLDQPNLLGRCKRAQVQWQFGQYINDFNLTYSDPNIRQSRISGSLTAYHSRSRFQIADLGGAIRTGGQVQLGFPVPQSIYTRLFVSYGGEKVRYENTGLLSTVATACANCFRSTLGFTAQHDTRTGLPFPADGGLQSFNAQFNGGDRASLLRADRTPWRQSPRGRADDVRGRTLGARGSGFWRHRSVLLLASVLGGRHAIRRAAPRLRRVLDHSERLQPERRSKPGEPVVLRKRLLRQYRRVGAPGQPVALHKHVLRRRQRLEQAARVRPDASVQELRLRSCHSESPWTFGCGHRVWVRQD